MTGRVLAAALLVALVAVPAGAQMPPGQEMPDAKQMSGVPLAMGDMPVGTVTVRVIRGSLANPIVNQVVEISGAAPGRKPTNESGRAEFPGLAPGTRVKAFTVVDGERLESQEIEVPAAGGIRVMLVASDPDAAKREAEDRRLAQLPAQRGIVVLGEQSRFVFEFGEEGLNVFNILQVMNTARTPVDPGAALVFEMPEGAEHAALLDGSTPLARVDGSRVEVKGPFPPGMTLLQFAYTMPYSGGRLSIRQVIPAQLSQVTVVAQKIGAMTLSSPQIAQQRDMASEGQVYILGQGPAVAAGGAVEFAFAGLPHTPTWPRNLALALVILILAAGAFTSVRAKGTMTKETARKALDAKRERLFRELVELEESHRAGRIAPDTYGRRRQHLVTALERIYAALDEEQAA
jgi:hypothetical protein